MTPRTVLIADDDPMIHLVLAETMREAGWTVHQAFDGAEAIALSKTTTFDAIVLDVRMPGLDPAITTSRTGSRCSRSTG